MKVYARPRQQGKTTDLIRLAAEEFLYVVCINQREVRRIADEAARMGLDIPFPITWGEFLGRRYQGKGVKGFVIDNLDLCIQQMTEVPIRAVSLNTEAEALVTQPR